MEAVPRLPMVSFDLKVSPDRPPVDFSRLKQYIRDFYNEDPESYSQEIRNLESLRAQAVHPVKDVTGCAILKKYYCQLHFLHSRFPMGKDGAAAVAFTWKDTYASMVCSIADIKFEMVAILYNIGALHSQLGAADDRTTPEGLKLACTHFQCAAWALQHLKDSYPQPSGVDLSPDLMQFMYHLCLAQAQECILEKSMTDNRKANINAKVAAQIVDYYNLALNALLQGPSEEGSIMDTVSTKLYKSWKKYTRFKSIYYSCVSLLYQGMQSEEQQKMGERVGFYQAALDKLNEAVKVSKGVDYPEAIVETLTFTRDVVEGKRKAAKNENEFIYHEEVPEADTLPTVKGASLVRGIPFNINDTEISGPDIFSRLVPMKAHEASSLYSEEKAKLLRRISGMIDAKDEEVVSFMSCLQLEHIKAHLDPTLLPQEIVDRCAALSAKPDAIPNLISAMDKLNDAYHDVDGMLKEILHLIKTEEIAEKEYQELMGPRPPSIVATDMTREGNKYMEAHKKAAESNDTLHRAMTQHIENLRVLQQPLSELQNQLPTLAPLNLSEDQTLKDVLMLVGKVEEMRRQRAMLACQLRESICSDDITTQLVTRATENMETIFQQEMQKHNRYVTLIEQNLAAQDNILPALTDGYAKYAPTRKATTEIIRQRDMMLSALVSSYDAYEDLIAKSSKGLEFYRKLETNLTKLLQRVKGTCKVQQEERDSILAKNGKRPLMQDMTDQVPSGSGLKLKDYLQSKKTSQMMPNPGNYYQTPGYPTQMDISGGTEGTQNWLPGVRPAPLGSEGTAPVCSGAPKQPNPQTSHTYSTPSTSYTGYAPQASPVPYVQGYGYTPKPYQTQQDPYSRQTYQYLYQQGTALQNLQYPTLSDHTYAAPPLPQEKLPQETPGQAMKAEAQYGNMTGTPQYSTPRGSDQQNTPYTPQHQYVGNTNTFQTPTQSYYSQARGAGQTTEVNQTPSSYYHTQGTMNPQYAQGTDTTSIYSYQNPQMTQIPQTETTPSQSYDPSKQTPVQNYTHTTPYSATNQVSSAGQYPAQDMYNQNVYGGYNTGYQNSMAGYQTQYPTGGTSVDKPSVTQQYSTGVYNNTGATSGHMNKPAETYTSPTPQNYYSQYSGYNYPPSGTQQPYQQQQQYPVGAETYYGVEYGGPQKQQSTQGHAYVGQTPSNTYNSYYSHPYAGFSTMSSSLQSPVNSPQQQIESANPTNQMQGNTDGSNAMPYNQTQPVPVASVEPAKEKGSNVDLLAGLDFTVNEVPLQPQQEIDKNLSQAQDKMSTLTLDQNLTSTQPKPSASSEESQPPQAEAVVTSASSNIKLEKPSPSKQALKDPFSDPEALSQFVQEVEKFEKFVDGLTTKTLNGPTPLDLKWNELQDLQEKDAHKQSISVARCYPMKNRFPDILPFDSTRVELPSTKDDYINASIAKDLGPSCPNFIMTQAPLPSTYTDFWTMVLDHQIELIVCLLAESQMNGEIYWAASKTSDLVLGKIKVVLQSCNVRGHWVERIMSVTNGKVSRVVVHLQFTAWPQRWFPESPGPLLSLVNEGVSVWGESRGKGSFVVHCDAGTGRCGVFVLITMAVMELRSSPHLPDLVTKAALLATFRKNPLRDRDHLKFAYQALLYYSQDLLMKRGILASKSTFEEKRTKPKSHTRHPSEDFLLSSLKEPGQSNPEERRASDASSTGSLKPNDADPLSQIDPLWPIKRFS